MYLSYILIDTMPPLQRCTVTLPQRERWQPEDFCNEKISGLKPKPYLGALYAAPRTTAVGGEADVKSLSSQTFQKIRWFLIQVYRPTARTRGAIATTTSSRTCVSACLRGRAAPLEAILTVKYKDEWAFKWRSGYLRIVRPAFVIKLIKTR